MKTTFSNIGILVRRAREANAISQSELSNRLGYKNSQFISNVERALCSIPAKKTPILAQVLNIRLDEIKEAMVRDYANNLENATQQALIDSNLIVNKEGRIDGIAI